MQYWFLGVARTQRSELRDDWMAHKTVPLVNFFIRYRQTPNNDIRIDQAITKSGAQLLVSKERLSQQRQMLILFEAFDFLAYSEDPSTWPQVL